MEARLQQALDRRLSEGTLRSLQSVEDLEKQQQQEGSTTLEPDFSSNDYLGLARCPVQRAFVSAAYQTAVGTSTAAPTLGATGSRLLSGDSLYCRKLEEWLAGLHRRPCSLVCNSGYDANLCITSCVPAQVVVLDELCHNSIHMGVRWNRHVATTITFRHNDVQDLTRVLQQRQLEGVVIMVIVESVYSMDGHVAPLEEILDVSKKFGAYVVVDEAHGLGVYGSSNRHELLLRYKESSATSIHSSAIAGVGGGTGVLAALELESHSALLCSVHTFGKAAGCHGAVLCCASRVLRDYLLNYARPFIYSTALPLHSLVTIRCSYETMIGRDADERRRHVFSLVYLFRRLVEGMLLAESVMQTRYPVSVRLCESNSPIQALLVPGNTLCMKFCQVMRQEYGILLYPIRAPTVPQGQERVRIILHAHNTVLQVQHLVECMGKTLQQIGQTKLSSRL